MVSNTTAMQDRTPHLRKQSSDGTQKFKSCCTKRYDVIETSVENEGCHIAVELQKGLGK
jgi:hypothetical protein